MKIKKKAAAKTNKQTTKTRHKETNKADTLAGENMREGWISVSPAAVRNINEGFSSPQG